MKYISFLSLCVFINLFLVSNANAQSIAIKGNLSYSSIGEVETSFITPGISLEGRAGQHWSIGADIGFGKNGTFSMFHFSPALKYYFGRSLRSFYLGAGIDAIRLKRENGGPIGYPFEDENARSGIAAGLQVMLGAQTIISNHIVLGFQLAAGYAPGIDSGIFHPLFSAGYVF